MKVVSGIRPTGNIHLGNYLGAIKQWKELQEKYECVFFVADLHVENNIKSMEYRNNVAHTLDVLRDCGIKEECLTLESLHYPGIYLIQHQLTFQVPVGWLNRMTQFKDKSETEEATLALLSYPVLMAADIFHFKGTHIPIGADQKQHIEFVRDLAQKTGHILPEPIIGQYPRIMSLIDGEKKMSKSDVNPDSCIFITDNPPEIRRKIMKAKSASDLRDNTPEMMNLIQIYRACGGTKLITVGKVRDFKEELAELVIKELHDK